MNDSGKLKEGALWLAIYLLGLFLFIFIPVIGLAALFVLPLPFLVFTAKHGWKSGILLFGGALILASFLVAVVSFPLTIVAASAGVLIGSAVYQKVTAYETWARGTLGFVIGLVLVFVFVQSVFGIDIKGEISQSIDASVMQSQQLLEDFGMAVPTEELAGLTAQMELFLDLLPVVLVAFAMFFAFITQWLGYKLLNRLDKRALKFPPFREYRLPVILVWIYFIAVLCTWIVTDSSSAVYIGAINVVNLIGLLIALQGFSFVLFYTHQKKLPKVLPTITIIIVIVFPFIGLYLMRILGIIDLGFSLRDRIVNENK